MKMFPLIGICVLALIGCGCVTAVKISGKDLDATFIGIISSVIIPTMAALLSWQKSVANGETAQQLLVKADEAKQAASLAARSATETNAAVVNAINAKG